MTVGAAVVDKIISAQSLVARAEAGELLWSELFVMVDTAKDLEAEDPYEFVGNLYFGFRITEAAANAYKTVHTPIKKVVREMVGWARRQRAAIEQQLEINASYEPKSGLERLGQFAVEEKCRWALRLLDESFPAWGY